MIWGKMRQSLIWVFLFIYIYRDTWRLFSKYNLAIHPIHRSPIKRSNKRNRREIKLLECIIYILSIYAIIS